LKKFQSTPPPRVRFIVVPVNAPFGILDVERPCPSTSYFEDSDLARRYGEPLPACPFLTKVSVPGWSPVASAYQVIQADR
jgi:hypothetical protein